MTRVRARAVAVCLVALLCGACGGSSVSCPNDTLACTLPAPSYASSVSTIIQSRCVSCHGPGGQQASMPFTSYQQIFAARSPILNQVYACRMPPAGAAELTMGERTQLLGWLACSAPNN